MNKEEKEENQVEVHVCILVFSKVVSGLRKFAYGREREREVY